MIGTMETTHPLDQPGVRSLIVSSLNVTKQVISNWKARGVPAEYCPQIEALTNGQVRCEDLRPDVQWSVLRRKAKPVKATPTTEAA
jgi:DNA-binding transcriptional regulator YdaS (Cro superfamily)